ncbi:MAG: tetratricopeptide repeat protein [Thermoguttaceae bacterium]
MQRRFPSLAVVFLSCIAIAANLNAEDAADYINRGNAYYEKGEYDKAIDSFNEAIRLAPKDAFAYGNRGNVWERKREYDKAIADHNEAIRLAPNDAHLYFNRGNTWAMMGKDDKVIADYTEAIRLDPNFAIAYRRRGATWGRKGEYDKAITDLNEAIRINPKDATAYTTRGSNWGKKREFDKAITDYTEAIRLDPKDTMTYVWRGATWKIKGEYDKAVADFDQALSINPKDVVACNGLAWLYATCPDEKYRDGKKAVENANKAYQLTEGKVSAVIDTLAAAYAESGDFEKAKEWGAKAIEMAATDKSVTVKNKVELASRLELYKQGKPYYEEPKKVEGQGRASEDTRIWTAANGKYTVKATFVSSDTTKVKLKKEDETIITVDLDRLSDEDQAWIKKRSRQ